MGSGGSKHKYQGSRNANQAAADRPSPPGKPYLLPGSPRSDPDVITIKWAPPIYNGGSKITGYLVEHKRTGSPHWVKATPLMVRQTQLSLSGLEPGMRYQFRITAENCMGRSDPGQVSEPFAISHNKGVAVAPVFVRSVIDQTAIENDKVEFLVQVEGIPTPKISWYKDGFEVFSNRRQRVSTDGEISSFVIHQAALSDEGEIKCSATNKAGHAVAKAKLTLEAPPSVRLPRQYEDGLLFELGEVVRFKVSISGQPQPKITWFHNGNILLPNNRVELASTAKYAMLRITDARREDRGEYQIKAKNTIGDDMGSFLVTITDRPLPPSKVAVVMTLGRCVTLSWGAPKDDGGCKIGNYIVEYYRIGWNMWLKAATCRQLSTTIGDLIEGSEYKFRVKAENPYGISDPSEESDVIFIPDPKRGLLEPPVRSNQTFLDETPDSWLESRKLAQQNVVEMNSTLRNQSQKKKIGDDWAFEEDESPIPSPVVLANQVLKKVKLAPKRGWSEDSQPSFEEPDKIEPPVPPKRKNRPSGFNEKQNWKSLRSYQETMDHNKDWDTRDFSPAYSPTGEELHSSSEMMLVLVPNSRAQTEERDVTEEKITAEELEKEPSVAPPMSLSAPELSSCEPILLSLLRASVSSSEIMYELAIARINKEFDMEEAEINLRKRYGIDRKRSFERRTSKNKDDYLDIIKEKSVSAEKITTIKDDKINLIKNKTEDDNFHKVETTLENKKSEQFSERFIQLEQNFKDYTTKYDFENPSDIDSIDRMSLDISDEVEEETYHPRAAKGTFTPITINVPSLPRVQYEMGKQISLSINTNDDYNFDDFRNDDNFIRSNTPSPEIKIEPSIVEKPTTSPRSSPLHVPDEGKLLLTPKPILKVRDRSVDRSDISDTEHTHQKKVRIEAPEDKNINIDKIAREENDIGLTAGEVARNRRMKLQQPKELNDPMNVVISHYSDIVKEYGQPKKSPTKLYLSYDELKAAAEKTENTLAIEQVSEEIKEEIVEEKLSPSSSSEIPQSKLVIKHDKPNLYRDYILNVLLFFVACWLYVFHDPILVIPILILMMYRQVSEALHKKIEKLFKKK